MSSQVLDRDQRRHKRSSASHRGARRSDLPLPEVSSVRSARRPSSAVGRAGTVRKTSVLPVAVPRISATTRWVIGAVGVLCVLAAALALWKALSDPARFPVSNVDVLGTLDFTDRSVLQSKVEVFTGQGFYTLDIEALRSAVESLPWVAEARIAREWPGRVKVTVEEHEPAARWNDDGLVSKRLELFQPPQLSRDDVRYTEWQSVFASLPELRGDAGRHSAVLDDYRRYSEALGALGLRVTGLVEDARLSQTIELDGNVTLRLGYEDHERRLGRFVDVYPRFAESLKSDPVTFDMRYSDGFSLAGARGL